MRRTLIASLFLSTLLPLQAEAQRAKASHRKPFARFSESAARLKDSLNARVAALSATSMAPLKVASIEHETQLRDSIVAVARSQIGTRYRLGAQTPGRAFDCSGLIRYVLGMFKLDLPRTANEQAKIGDYVALDTTELRPGDLVTFGRGKRVSHIGIYVGDGRIVHASTSQRRVVESTIEGENWFVRRWMGARRVLAIATTADTVAH
jgi:cell wall-associated NlpC family hydrolase